MKKFQSCSYFVSHIQAFSVSFCKKSGKLLLILQSLEGMKLVEQKKQRYRATIAGKTYTIIGKKSHQHMHSVIHLLNTQWDDLSKVMPSSSDAEKAILLAVNAISAQLDKQMEIEALKKEIEKIKKSHSRVGKRQSIASDKKEQLEKQFAQQQDLLRK